MTPDERANLQASVRQRLLDIARRDGVDFQLVLTRYGLERFLHRLGRSRHKPSFLLKGAFLFHAWQDDVDRPTRDLDLLGHGPPDIARLEAVVADIAGTDVEDDGLVFAADTIRGAAIRETALYDGIRMRLDALLGRARIPLQVDIGFGDAATPSAVELEYPTLLDQAPPTIMAYRPEYVVAEKLEAMVALGEINTRLKDYYDLWKLSGTMDMAKDDLIGAIRATFSRRGTMIPVETPPGLADTFADPEKSMMWRAFLERSSLDAGGLSLVDVVRELRSSLWALIEEAGCTTSGEDPAEGVQGKDRGRKL